MIVMWTWDFVIRSQIPKKHIPKKYVEYKKTAQYNFSVFLQQSQHSSHDHKKYQLSKYCWQ